jgi:HAD superfamily hydrolase (TIGR01459 family)
MMPDTIQFDALIDRFDVFLLDQFGVLLDEAGAYEGAVTALKMLADAGKQIAVVSNSGKTSMANRMRMATLGIPVGCIDHIVTSGEIGRTHLKQLAGEAGDLQIFPMARGGDTTVLYGIGCQIASRAEDAELIVLSGSEADIHGLEACLKGLRAAAKKGVPCLCLNPDMVMLTADGTAPGAGAIAQGYAQMGGKVTWIGKPHGEIFANAIASVGASDQARVCVIGDSLSHDIAGGNAIDATTVLVRTGIHADAAAHDLPSLFAQHGAKPDFVMDAFAPAHVNLTRSGC